MKSTEILESKAIPFRVIELAGRAISVADVVRLSKGNIKIDEICKTIIFKTKSGKFIAVFLLGADKIDTNKLKEIIGEQVSVANVSEVKQIASVEPGAVCPLLLNIPLFVDKKVLAKPEINFGSGDHLKGIIMKPQDLIKAIECKIEEVSQD